MAASIDFKNLKNLYLLFGEERYLVLENEKRIAETVVPDGGFADMNRSIYKGAADAGMIMDDCGTLPFMAERKVIVVRDSGLFARGRKDDTDIMCARLEELPESTVLVFSEEKVEKNNSLYKRVNKLGGCVEFKRLKETELTAFIKKQSKNGIDCPDYFVASIGDDMEKLLGELRKAEEYAGGRAVTKEDIDAVCSKSFDTYVFNMTKALGRRDTAAALEIYENMLAYKDKKESSPFGILVLLAAQLRSILECKQLAAKGLSIAETAERLGIKEWQAKNYAAQARNFTNSELLNGLNACYKCDHDAKTGRILPELGLEIVIVGLGKRSG